MAGEAVAQARGLRRGASPSGRSGWRTARTPALSGSTGTANPSGMMAAQGLRRHPGQCTGPRPRPPDPSSTGAPAGGRAEPSSWISTLPHRSAEASERRRSPSRRTDSRATSTWPATLGPPRTFSAPVLAAGPGVSWGSPRWPSRPREPFSVNGFRLALRTAVLPGQCRP